ncbi:MAG: hypothetical protein IJV04_08645 [Lachnospiraceae bacterium]|nr:hypothetical protein [Lachnospiraceae bacterium]
MRAKCWRALAAFVLAFSLILTGVCALPIQTDASVSYMNRLGVKFGIKPGRKYHFTQKLTGVGNRDITWTMRNVRKRKAKKKGYRELSCVLDFASNFSLSPIEVDAITATEYSKLNNNSGAHMWYAVVDGDTGLDLESDKKNKVKVTVKTKQLDYRYNTFYASDMETWQNAVFFWSTQVTITYPSDYKDLCVGFGGGNVLSGELTKADANFWKGKLPFGKTTFYTKGKANSRWLRVR